MRNALLLLLLAPVVFSVPIDIFEQKETAAGGVYHFDDFTATYDCNRTIVIHISSEPDGEAVKGATVRLFYEERYTPILDADTTGDEGDYIYVLIGPPEHMANLFMFTVEKQNFRTKEGHFVLPLAQCAAPPAQNQTTPPAPPPVQNQTQPPQQNQTAQNLTGNATWQNQTHLFNRSAANETGASPWKQIPFCPLFVILLLLVPVLRPFAG